VKDKLCLSRIECFAFRFSQSKAPFKKKKASVLSGIKGLTNKKPTYLQAGLPGII
jgi:hypothetical protein